MTSLPEVCYKMIMQSQPHHMSFLSVNGQPGLQTYPETWHAWTQARTNQSLHGCLYRSIKTLHPIAHLHIYLFESIRESLNVNKTRYTDSDQCCGIKLIK